MCTMARVILNAQHIADYFLWKAYREKKQITNKKLQKLLYYAQAWSLVLRNKKLFSDKIEAWVHGPAIRDVYFEYKNFGFSPITKIVSDGEIKKIPGETKRFLNQVWSVYGKRDPEYLEMLTHSETPWLEAREGLQSHESSKNEISLKTMKAFYSKKLEYAHK